MASVVYMHFCEHAFFNVNRRPCLIGIFGQKLFTHAFPVHIPSLTVAVGLHIPPKTTSDVTLTLSFEDGMPQRSWNLKTNGPDDETLESISFLPFKTLALFFRRPSVVVARLSEGGIVLSEVQLALTLGLSQHPSPLGVVNVDPDLQ